MASLATAFVGVGQGVCRKSEQSGCIRTAEECAPTSFCHLCLLALEDVLNLPLKRFREDKGQALLEVALCLPMLLLLVTGIMVFGLAINNYLMLTNATNTGAQTLAVNRAYTSDPCNTVATAVKAAAPNLVYANMVFTTTMDGVSYSGTSCASASPSTGAAANLVQGTPAVVNVTYPCNLTVYGKNFAPSCKLTSQTSVVIQ
jgi:Flp pilus assembly protein TadG